MRILWATPFNERSAIALFSLEVCRELTARGHDLTVFRTECGESAALAAKAAQFPIIETNQNFDEHAYDIIVLNLGNHSPNHGGGLDIAARHLPFLIFHDAEMRDFSWGMRHSQALDIDELARGTAGEADVDPIIPDGARDHLAFYSSLGCGAIVHGPHYRGSVAHSSSGPVGVVPLCFPDIGAISPRPSHTPPYRILIFGVINPNKQVERVLQAMRLLRDTTACELHLVGPIEDRARGSYSALALELQLPGPHCHGFVSDAELCEHIASADVVCCLRHPVSEGGSASLATALYAAQPVIVCDAASYTMVPDHCVSKVSYGENAADLAVALRQILEDKESASRKGAAGRAWALRAHSTKSYVDTLTPLLDEALSILPWLRTARQLAKALPLGHRLGPTSTGGQLASIMAELSG
jgi:glycosyltransferase involved in cell wall biosynthesis